MQSTPITTRLLGLMTVGTLHAFDPATTGGLDPCVRKRRTEPETSGYNGYRPASAWLQCAPTEGMP